MFDCRAPVKFIPVAGNGRFHSNESVAFIFAWQLLFFASNPAELPDISSVTFPPRQRIKWYMKTFKWLALTLAVALSAGGVFVLTSRAAEAAAQRPLAGKLRERAKEKLGLTDSQIGQIKQQLKSEKDNITTLLTRLHDARATLRAEIQKTDASETSVREAAAKLSAVESDLAVERLKLHGKISPILTADQREKLSQLQAGLDLLVSRAIERADKKLAE
jgi:Spy/CpxP family protein refolding chaperone